MPVTKIQTTRVLQAAMLAKCATSLLTPKHVKTLQFQVYAENHGLPIEPQWSGFRIPYFTPEGKVNQQFYRFRFLQDRPSTGVRALAVPEKPIRYTQPAGGSCGVYLPPLLKDGKSWASIQVDPTVPVVITEGELKSACGCVLGTPTIGLGGVYNWSSAKDKQELLPALEAFKWENRVVNLCFDSDIASNPMVKLAASRLAYTLAQRGANVVWTELPSAEDNKKQGMDDLAYVQGPQVLMDLLSKATAIGPGKALHRLNDEVAVVKQTSEIVELKTGNVFSAAAFTEVAYRNDTYVDWGTDGGPKKTKFTAREWLAWPFRNEVLRIEYEPGCADLITAGGAYNSWRGWACQPKNEGVITPWLNLLKRMFRDVPADQVEWMKCWFAYPIQYPGAKLATAILIWGRQQGTGKTMLGETMSYIYGRNYGTVTNTELASQFNEWLMDKSFIVGDELALGDKRHTASGIKDMITRTQVRINSKNRKTYAVRDCANFYLTSNHEDALYLEAGDRRVFVHRVDADPLSPPEYQAYWRWLKEEGGAARLFYYLINEVDCSLFDPQGRAPMTTAKIDMTTSGRGDTEDWCVLVATEPDTVISQPYDLFTTKDLLSFYDPDGKGSTRIIGMGKALGAAGVHKMPGGNNAVVQGMRTRLWAIRNAGHYRLMGPAQASRAYEEERQRLAPGGVGSNRKFAGPTGRVQ